MRPKYRLIVYQDEEPIYTLATNDKALVRRQHINYSYKKCYVQLWVDNKPLGPSKAMHFCKRKTRREVFGNA